MSYKITERCRKALSLKRGDIYFEYLICLLLFIAALSVTIQTLSAVSLKFWLDGRTSAIVRNVQINGEITETAEEIIGEVADRLGGESTFEWDARFIPGTDRIQLGDTVRLRITAEIVLFSIGTSRVMITISSETVGTSEIYWKEP